MPFGLGRGQGRGHRRRRNRGQGRGAGAPGAPCTDSQAMDEVFEELWMHEEAHADAAMPEESLLERLNTPGSGALLARMAEEDLVRHEDGHWRLEKAGRGRAREVIRRHRLAERLFVDVLELEAEFLESNACSFEHAISREVAEQICTLLGHPSTCPHGLPIPPGDCCERFRTDAGPMVMPLARLPVGATGHIAYIATRSHARLDRLGALGIVPGAELRLHQRKPSYVVFVGETQFALDEETAREVYVRPPRAGSAAD